MAIWMLSGWHFRASISWRQMTLLEMLGPSMDPQCVQRHLKKCFEGEQSLAFCSALSCKACF